MRTKRIRRAGIDAANIVKPVSADAQIMMLEQ